jgi:hypothetical protein
VEAPISTRQPRDETRPLELDLDDDEPPESGEVASQRKPAMEAAPEVQTAASAQAAPAVAEAPDVDLASFADPLPRPALPARGVARFVSAARAVRPPTFGELLARSVDLGKARPGRNPGEEP